MIRRLEIAQSVLHHPLILFLDEPTVGLDPLARESVWQYVKQLAENGTTILMTTHYMEEAEAMCNRVAIMVRGKVSAIGTPEELKISIGFKDANFNEVFDFYAGKALESEEQGGNFKDISRTRRDAKRLG